MNWGTPTPVTTRVVQMDPGPTPTFTAFAPRSRTALAPSAVATFPAMSWTSGKASRTLATAWRTPSEWPWAVSMTRTSTPALDESFGPSQIRPGGPDGRTNPQAAMFVLAGIRELAAFEDVLDGDEAGQVPLIVHHREFFDPVLVEESFGFRRGSSPRAPSPAPWRS